MADETKIGPATGVEKTRRSVVTTAAQVAVTAPAVGLLLSATTVPASATSLYQATVNKILDDYTFGNEHEDIDTARYGNFNPRNGTANQDDHVVG